MKKTIYKTVLQITVLSLAILAVLLSGCKRFTPDLSYSPTFFVIQDVYQNSDRKEKNVALYKVEAYSTFHDGSLLFVNRYWFVLEDKFQVGDTLKFIKK